MQQNNTDHTPAPQPTGGAPVPPARANVTSGLFAASKPCTLHVVVMNVSSGSGEGQTVYTTGKQAQAAVLLSQGPHEGNCIAVADMPRIRRVHKDGVFKISANDLAMGVTGCTRQQCN
eukprot:1037683-Rhodomonas_salina.1